MQIKKVTKNKKKYLSLLLLADEQESMIDRYLDRGDMYILEDHGIQAECVITKEAKGVYELKNIAVIPESQGKGYGKALISYLIQAYSDCKTMIVGTGDSPLTIPFYKACGFQEYRRVKNFFPDNYDHPIFECGRQLVDMVYLKREIGNACEIN